MEQHGEPDDLTGRDRALLRAVAAGRCQLGAGCEPVLLVDGLTCADGTAAHRLVTAGLIAPADAGTPGSSGAAEGAVAPAVLTPVGRAALTPLAAAG